MPSIVLPKPDSFGDVKAWAHAFVRELEEFFGGASPHVVTVGIPKARLPSATKTGVIVTVLDDSVVGKVQCYSDGTTWRRIFDDKAVDAALDTHVNSLNALSGALTLVAGGIVTITPGSPGASDITVSASAHPPQDIADRTYVKSSADHGAVTSSLANVSEFTGISITGAATGNKKFDVSFGCQFYWDGSSTPTDWIEIGVYLGTNGTATGGSPDTEVLRKRTQLGLYQPPWIPLSFADFEIQTTSASDKITIATRRAGALGTINLLGASPYFSHLRVKEVLV